jgi:hypothetical protein
MIIVLGLAIVWRALPRESQLRHICDWQALLNVQRPGLSVIASCLRPNVAAPTDANLFASAPSKPLLRSVFA